MKRILLIALFGFFLNDYTNASHLMGGEVTVELVSGNTYEVTLKLYRDVLGINISMSPILIIDSAGSGNWATMPMVFDNTTGNLIIGPYGVEMYRFTGVVTLPANGSYTIWYTQCCRNGAILNSASPGSESMYLSATIHTYAASAANSTPVFLAPPVVFVPNGFAWQYNPLPFDADGDSLVWSIDHPMNSVSIPIVGWVPPYSDPAGPFSIDSQTGEVTWTASTVGNFVASFLIDEYRNGVKIGNMRRDMQLIVVHDTTNVPRIANFNTVFPLNNNGHNYITLASGNNFSVTLQGMDDDENNVLTLEAFGEPFLQHNNSATFSSTTSANGTISGTFQWAPNNFQERVDEYIVVFRISDGSWVYDETVLMKVGSGVGITENSSNSFGNIYPNPVNKSVFIPANLLQASDLSVKIYDITCKMVANYPPKRFVKGSHLMGYNFDLTSGQYLMVIESDNSIVSTQKIIVNKSK